MTRRGLPRSEAAKRPSRVVRKGGFEPPRSCERQPLKQRQARIRTDHSRSDQTDPAQTGTEEGASDDWIRTDSHIGEA